MNKVWMVALVILLSVLVGIGTYYLAIANNHGITRSTTTNTTTTKTAIVGNTTTTTTSSQTVKPPVDFSKLTPIKTSLSKEDLLRLYSDLLRNKTCSTYNIGFSGPIFINPFAPPPSIETGHTTLPRSADQSLPANITLPTECSVSFAYYDDIVEYRFDQGHGYYYVINGGEFITLSAPVIYSDGTVYIEVDYFHGPLYASGGWVNMTKTSSGSWVVHSRGNLWIS